MKTEENNSEGKRRFGFWWYVVIAFGLMFAVWMTLFILAASHPVQEIPRKTSMRQEMDGIA